MQQISKKDNFIIKETVKMMLLYARKNSKPWEMLVAVDNNRGDEDWDTGKLNRWIGYAQCLLVAEGAITLDETMRIGREIAQAANEAEKDGVL